MEAAVVVAIIIYAVIRCILGPHYSPFTRNFFNS